MDSGKWTTGPFVDSGGVANVGVGGVVGDVATVGWATVGVGPLFIGSGDGCIVGVVTSVGCGAIVDCGACTTCT